MMVLERLPDFIRLQEAYYEEQEEQQVQRRRDGPLPYAIPVASCFFLQPCDASPGTLMEVMTEIFRTFYQQNTAENTARAYRYYRENTSVSSLTPQGIVDFLESLWQDEYGSLRRLPMRVLSVGVSRTSA